MNAKIHFEVEYVACGLMPDGKWRHITTNRYRSKEHAKQQLEHHLQLKKENPYFYPNVTEYKIMRRTTITALGEWEDIEPGEEVRT